MRSKLGTKSRLAAHILALILLILMLVYTAPETKSPEPQPRPIKPSVSIHPARPVSESHAVSPGVGTLDRVQTPAVATRADAEELRPPSTSASPRGERPPVAAPGIARQDPEQPGTLDSAASLRPHTEPLRPPSEPDQTLQSESGDAVQQGEADSVSSETIPEEILEETPHPESDPTADGDVLAEKEMESAADAVPSTAAPANEPETAPVGMDGVEDESTPESTPEIGDTSETTNVPESTPVENNDDLVAQPQPDESGALVVAPSETGAIKPVAAATPLPNANIEVLGDGVYWLDPRHDLETELAAVPELRSLVLLTPLPGYRVQGFDHVRTEFLAADPADLTSDAAERFIHLTQAANRPVVVAVLPGTRGAAFFKGAYLLRNRSLSTEDMLREIAAELDDAGEARDDIIHRLMRLKN